MTDARDARTIAGWLRIYGETGNFPPEVGNYMDLFSDDIVWAVKGQGLAYTREYKGKSDLLNEYMLKLQARLDNSVSQIRQVGVYVDDDQQMITTHNSENLVLKNGKTLSVEAAFLMSVRGGLIVHVAEFVDLRPIEAAFGSEL